MSHSPFVVTPRRPPASNAAVRWLAILLLVVAGALIYLVIDQRRHRAGEASARPAPESSWQPHDVVIPKDLGADEQATIGVFENASRSVVHITSIESHKDQFNMDVMDLPQGTGTGFVWDSAGHIVTNFHVIQQGNTAKVTLSDGAVYDATIVGSAPDKDLAVLRIDADPSKLHALTVGSSSNLKVGQKVLAIGNPFGFDQTLTTGVISGLGREIKSVTGRPIYDVVQTDAAINPGNSGGPLLDSHGNLIGVNTAIYSPSGAYAGIGFAVPVDTINQIVPQIIKTNGKLTRPGLGIAIGADQIARKMGINGVIIMQVQPGSAAQQAGLEGVSKDPSGRVAVGDVIIAVDGTPVLAQNDLFKALDKHQVGDTVAVTVKRGSTERRVEVTLQAIPQ